MLKDVSLVFMPWASVSMPSVALGLLKSILENNNVQTDVHYLNVKLAKLMDEVLYEEISSSTIYVSEWLFSLFLFNEDIILRNDFNYDEFITGVIDQDHYLYMYLKKRKDVIEPLIKKVLPQFLDECLSTVNWGEYKVIGFSCMVGYQISSLLLSKKIKERFPHIKVIFGGPNVREKTGEEILRNFEWVDYIIDGEGEETLLNLVKNIKENNLYERVHGVLFRRDGFVERAEQLQAPMSLDEIPIPDYVDYYNQIEGSKIKEVLPIRTVFESSRGCWWGQKCQCSFCGLSNGYLKYRCKSSEKVMEELLVQIDKYNNKTFFATDLILSSESFDNLIPELIRRKLDLCIFYEVKANLKRNQVKLLSEAGITEVQAGIESLNTKLLKLLRKGVTAIQNIQFLKLCEENSISVSWNLLYRIPGEDKECYDEIIELIPSIVHLRPPSTGMIIPIALDRFSPYYTNPEKYGIKDIKPKGTFNLIYPIENIDLNNIAYTFDFSFDNADETVLNYIGDLADAVVNWQKSYEDRTFFFNYSLNNTLVEIEDNRPVSFSNTTNCTNKYVLEGLDKEIFMYCNDIHSIKEIYSHINNNCGLSVEENQILKVLAELKDKRLLYEECDRYVNLATYKSK